MQPNWFSPKRSNNYSEGPAIKTSLPLYLQTSDRPLLPSFHSYQCGFVSYLQRLDV